MKTIPNSSKIQDEILLTYLRIMNLFFNQRGYALSFLFQRSSTDRDGSIISFSKICEPPIGRTFTEITYTIEYINFTIENFTRIEACPLGRKRTIDIKSLLKDVTNKPESVQQLEALLMSYCDVIDKYFFDKQ